MTPQDKAKELLLKYEQIVVTSLHTTLFMRKDSRWSEQSKQCAIIACDEVLQEPAVEFNQYRREYWQSVKAELLNL